MGKIQRRQEDEPAGHPMGPRRTKSSEVVLSPSVLSITEWTVDENPDRLVALVVPGATHFDRQVVLKQYVEGDWHRFHPGIVVDAGLEASEWIDTSVVENFLVRVLRMKLPVLDKTQVPKWYPHVGGAWELLWNLLAVDEFLVDEPLRSMVDQPFYLVHDVHRALWEARFLAREHPTLDQAERFMTALTRWISGEPLGDDGRQLLSAIGIKRLVSSPAEKLDVLCFLLSLAYQNGLLERTVFLFDDLENALQPNRRASLRQLRDFIDGVRRWSRLGGSPIGILLGFTGTRTDLQLLGKYNTKLAVDVTAGLNWARRSVS
jgi:hypothetical protein